MIFLAPKKARPAAANTEAPSVEQTLREAAAWEPNCPPPADFAAFTRRALKNRANKTNPPANRSALPVQWVRSLRAPLAAGLALGFVLWVSNSPNELPRDQLSETTRNVARPVVGAKPAESNPAPQTAKMAVPVGQATQNTGGSAARPLLVKADAQGAGFVLASHRARVRRHKRHGMTNGATHAVGTIAARGVNKTNPAPLWKTETVERPAWGALIPATFACTSAPASVEGGPGSEGVETTTLMPVVLDVALPETANLAAASFTGNPPAP